MHFVPIWRFLRRMYPKWGMNRRLFFVYLHAHADGEFGAEHAAVPEPGESP